MAAILNRTGSKSYLVVDVHRKFSFWEFYSDLPSALRDIKQVNTGEMIIAESLPASDDDDGNVLNL